MDHYRHKRVLITGFTPYKGIETNPSWEGVNCMNTNELQYKYNIELTLKEINVSYEDVDVKIPRLWRNLRPDLTIHVGVSPNVSCFMLETQANRRGYTNEDNNTSKPLNTENMCEGPETLVTQLDVATICRKFNRSEENLHAKISSAAGLFLCEYIYYTSLCYGRSPTLFVHVPLVKYTSKQLAQGLERILELCLKQLNKDDYDSYNVLQMLDYNLDLLI